MASRLRKPLVETIAKWKILRGDKVAVTAGKYAGQQGVVQSVDRKRNLVKIEGINLAKKNVASTKDRKGGIYPIEKGVHYSNVHVLDPSDGAPTRVAFRFLETGEKVRVSKRTGVVIPRPAILTLKDKHKDGAKDTLPSDVLAVTYLPSSSSTSSTPTTQGAATS